MNRWIQLAVARRANVAWRPRRRPRQRVRPQRVRIALADAEFAQGSLVGYHSQMKIANLVDVKNDLSRFVAEVRRGGRVRILVRGVPAADLVPVEKPESANERDDFELTELETLGLVRRSVASLSSRDTRELERPGPRVRGGRAVESLLAERKGAR